MFCKIKRRDWLRSFISYSYLADKRYMTSNSGCIIKSGDYQSLIYIKKTGFIGFNEHFQENLIASSRG